MNKMNVTLMGVLAVIVCLVGLTTVAQASPSVSDPNILSGMSASATTHDLVPPEPHWLPECATDGIAVITDGVKGDWVTQDPASDNPRLAVWGLQQCD